MHEYINSNVTATSKIGDPYMSWALVRINVIKGHDSEPWGQEEAALICETKLNMKLCNTSYTCEQISLKIHQNEWTEKVFQQIINALSICEAFHLKQFALYNCM